MQKATIAKTKTVINKEIDTDDLLNKQAQLREVKIPQRKNLTSLAEKIANDTLFYRNHYYPGGKESFANNKALQTVDKYFPYAEGGPLFVDELSRLDSVKNYEAKKEVMKKLGHRYVAITPGMDENDIREVLA